jgi:hypothetical protein
VHPEQPRDPPWLLRQRQGSDRSDHRVRGRLQARSRPFAWTAIADDMLSSREFVMLFLGCHTSCPRDGVGSAARALIVTVLTYWRVRAAAGGPRA